MSETAQIFLSYATQDRQAVTSLYHKLRDAGYQPWLDYLDIQPGETWREKIQRTIKKCNFFLACLSSSSIDKRGILQWEIKYALDLRTQKLDTDIFLIPVRLEEIELPEALSDIQWVDFYQEDGWSRLRRAIESQGFPGIDRPATEVDERWALVRKVRQATLDLISPAYILDQTYHFLDWNPAFDELLAKPIGLKRGDHGLEFIRRLVNFQDVIERSKIVFGPGKDPLVDLELLLYCSEKFGTIHFQKLASQLVDEHGSAKAWVVNLNILAADKMDELWQALQIRLESELNWSRYAVSYDRLLAPFDDYNNLVALVAGMAGDARRCLDVGAGTGNGTVSLLRANSEREVWAVESNENMLDLLRAKVRKCDQAGTSNFFERLSIVKEDAVRLNDLPSSYFDAAILINVLYALDDPRRCLEQVYRLLRPGGVLALSCPHRETDVEKLLRRMRKVLEEKKLFDDLRHHYEVAVRIHERLEHRIHRNTKDEIRGYLESAGFTIEEWRDHEYVDAVVVVKARK